MEYDFSKIETEELRKAVDIQKENMYSCGEIKCDICPYKDTECSSMVGRINNSFKEELIRREKMENKMPELEAGMVVEKIWDDIGTHLYLVLGNGSWGSCLTRQGYSGPIFEGGEITKLFTANEPCSIYDLKNIENLKLIWSRKSDKDIKIEELEKELQHLEEDHSKKVSEIRDRLQELKG